MEGGYYPSTAPIPSQELKTEYNELEKFLGVESMVWNAPIDPAPKHIYIDLRGAYLGCKDSEQSASEALPWRRACVENIEAVRCLTGVVQLIPTPLIDYLLSTGWLINATPKEIIYSVGKKSRIEFPPSRDLAVRFVGSCARNAQVTSVLIRDKNEADMIHQWLARKKCRPNRISNKHRTLIKYEGDKKPIPETILDESKLEIDFDKELFANAKNDIELEEVYKRYDAEVDKIKKQYESVIVLDTLEIKYGQWHKKKSGYIYRKKASSWTINHKTSGNFNRYKFTEI
ncbi:hypothetical protein Glove_16g102 [Diversispora epigaea]|uniref:Uncharacterized protein n=1 Tax=Diversispora epigaea TaxID=1348612 RepID=A0A397JLU2_9GLOM|nr:hypothetical protein Glove_16g102 [Diversispora epigaea]